MPSLVSSDVAHKAVNLIRRLFAPGLRCRESEPFDPRYYHQGDFDPEFNDDLDDYMTRWERREWPKQKEFEEVLAQLQFCVRHKPTTFTFKLLGYLERIYNEVFNRFESTFNTGDRHDCIMFLIDNNILKKLQYELPMEEPEHIPFTFDLDERNANNDDE